jgi:tRNA modification GTPase
MAHADRILFVIDAAEDPTARAYAAERARLPPNVPVTLVFNKIDLCDRSVSARCGALETIRLSALSGEGLQDLREHLKASMGFTAVGAGVLSARARHLEALARCAEHLQAAGQRLIERGGRELVAEELKGAQRALGEIIGEESSDELLGRIFAAFCICRVLHRKITASISVMTSYGSAQDVLILLNLRGARDSHGIHLTCVTKARRRSTLK